ncbi:MAG: glycosyltransferase [Proteobacteria bacterium]|nr:glycosyltransferase [Pseudomonadota bacterium]
MNLLLLGSNYFRQALLEEGHEVVWAGDDPSCDLPLPPEKVDVPYILSRLDFRPEALVLTDDLGRRVLPTGLERTDLLKAWYAVDSPLNLYWQVHFAPLFDLVLVDQKKQADLIGRNTPAGAIWLPVAVHTGLYQGPAERKKYDLGFVGVINPSVRPKRSRIVESLSSRFVMYTAGGRRGAWVSPEEAGRIYRRSRMVLNENLFDGVTTRMMEAMASGTMLLTEASTNGLGDLFSPGEDLVAFGPSNLFDQVEYYLANDTERQRVADRGRRVVLETHDVRHRARRLVDLFAGARPGLGLTEGTSFFRQSGRAWFWVGLRWPGHDGLKRLVRAERYLRRAERGGDLTPSDRFALGHLAMLQGREAEARARFESAREAGSVQAALSLGFMELEAGREGRAIDEFNRAALAAGVDPFSDLSIPGGPSADLHHALGRVLEAVGQDLTPGFSRRGLHPGLWTAAEHYQAALRIDPDHASSLAGLGLLLSRYEAYAEAHAFLSRAAGLAPEREDLAEAASRAAERGYANCPGMRKVA